MSIYRELAINEPIERVTGVQFSVLSAEQLRQRSVVEVNKPEAYFNMDPVPHGLFDLRMGAIDHNRVCQTCEQKNTFCPGHFGHIELAKPVFYIQFFDTVKKILKCVCFKCGNLLINPKRPDVVRIMARRASRQKRWEAIYKLCSNVRKCGQDCEGGCGAKMPNSINGTDVMLIRMEWKDTTDKTMTVLREILLTAEDTLRILRRISDAHADVLGFSPTFVRPEWLVCTVFPVPPPSVRPSVRTDSNVRQEDDLTHKLSDIVKFNTKLRQKIENGGTPEQIQAVETMLQYHVATIVDNNIPHLLVSKDRSTGRVFRSITDRLKHKDGRIRGNLMGKRVDFSARSVITPDPNISIEELGVPRKIAMNLTFPEVVHPRNIDDLTRLVRNGPDVYPGAKNIRKTAQGNRTIRLRGNADAATLILEIGDIVERHLHDGDWVLFNRQPSLHKMSMMAHRVRVVDGNTFRLNVCVCQCYNADFDGDEMNMHVPQSYQTMFEIMHLAAVRLHILSPRYSRPIISIVQDIAVGVFRMTQDNVRVSECQMFNLVSRNPVLDISRLRCAGVGDRVATGRELLSTVIPPNVHASIKEDDDSTHGDRTVVVRDSHIVEGILTANAYKTASRGLVHAIHNDQGASVVTTFIDNTQKIVCDWLVLSGFSVGVSDLVSPMPDAAENVRRVAHDIKVKVYDKIHEIHSGVFDNVSTKSNRDFLEEQIRDITSAGAMAARKAGTAGFDADNRMLNMISAGSKGSHVNFTQMVACLGQQFIDNKRIADGFDHRTLPHYTRYDDGPESRGFIEHSFIAGLTPQEFFFHSMAGRVGLIDTAVRSVTRETAIIIMEEGRVRYVHIGEWIDAHLARAEASKGVKHYPDDRNLEMLDVPNVFIPTLDEDGRVTWGALTSVTRHDPGQRLYKVKTQGGREVTVAESQSLLVWDEGKRKFLPKHSPEVSVGDFLPVTMKLADPPTIINFVDMAEYLPKTEHIYGTYFNRAVAMTADAQGESFHIPRGWWSANNGNAFTLPYTKKALLTRAMSGRSNVDNIDDGLVYPYHATRCHGGVPERFELTKENGTFIGLYLADGHTCEKSGIVGISKNDTDVQDFVIDWFTRHGFTSRIQANTNDIGTSYTVMGHSTLLARFLDRFVGHGAHQKFVPDVAFAAPEEFVCGLLSGYFSGDGSVGRGAVTSSSVSKRLNEGIALLCARLGAFAKISTRLTKSRVPRLRDPIEDIPLAPMYDLSVRAQWATILAEKLDLVHPAKRDALAAMRCTEKHVNYPAQNDVVLDKIASIEIIGVESHPKLYDVTVPSTLNFVIANGLGVVDTSETGYIQRQLIKVMEDCKVHHDLSVRNATGHVVQFLFGEDGMDAVKLEYHAYPPASTLPAEMRCAHVWTSDAEIDRLVNEDVIAELSGGDWMDRVESHFSTMLQDRRDVITNIMKGRSGNATLVYPVSFQRILDNITALFAACGVAPRGPSDLSPIHVLDTIDILLTELRVGVEDTRACLTLRALLRFYLSPRPLIHKRHMTRLAFDRVVQQIRTAFFGALANPGEMVGVVAAQSIGEPTTQMTLNSVHYDTEMLLRVDGVLIRTTIGDFVEGRIAEVRGDGVLVARKAFDDATEVLRGLTKRKSDSADSADDGVVNVSRTRLAQVRAQLDLATEALAIAETHAAELSSRLELHPKDQTFAWLKDKDGHTKSGVEVLSCDDVGRVTWREVEAVTRHPVVNRDGTNTLLRVTTHSGRTVTATKGESFLTRRDNKILPTKGEDLRCGATCDYLPVSRIFPVDDKPLMHLDVSRYLPKDMFMYESEVAKAIVFSKTECNWFKRHKRDFTTPFSRGDALLESTRTLTLSKGCVYPKTMNRTTSVIPEMFVLDEEFGFFIGAYLAEGCVSPTQTVISNNDPAYRKRVTDFCDRYGMGWHLQSHHSNGGLSESVYIHSTLFTELMLQMCKKLAHNKRFPAELFAAPDEFIVGVMDGYFSGDGCVEADGRFVAAASVSNGLLQDIRQLLLRYDIVSRIRTDKTKREERFHVGHTLTINGMSTVRFGERFHMVIENKQQRLNLALSRDHSRLTGRYGNNDIVPDVEFSWGKMSITRDDVDRLDRTSTVDDHALLQRIRDEQILYDEIVSIEEVANDKPYAYDLTVEGTRNFNTHAGLACLDTFHSTGQASGAASGNTLSGVARMRELIHVSKEIKTPFMSIYLPAEVRKSAEKAEELVSEVQTTCFRDVVTSTCIYYDPPESATLVADDVGLTAFYRELQALNGEGAAAGTQSPWLLRFEFDRMKMLRLQITMLDLEFVLTDWYESQISCIFSDDNADRLVCRLRLVTPPPTAAATAATAAAAAAAAASNEDGGAVEMPNQIVRLEDDLLSDLRALEQTLLDRIVVKGIPGVHRAIRKHDKGGVTDRYDTISDAFVPHEEHVIYTNGTNLLDVLSHPLVDSSRVMTNDVVEVYHVLGVEAARRALLVELRAVMQDIEVDFRHLSLLVDVMTRGGNLLSVNRHGINRGDIGPLAKCSFEETTDMLIKAGMFADKDNLDGVSANIMLGQVAPCGTGCVELLMDDHIIARLGKTLWVDNDVQTASPAPHTIPRAPLVVESLTLPDASIAVREKVADDLVFV